MASSTSLGLPDGGAAKVGAHFLRGRVEELGGGMLGPELGNRVDYVDVLAYLESRGWCRIPSRRSYAAIYRSGREPLVEAQVPLDRNLADYGEAITVVAQRLAAFERRSAEAVMDDLLRLGSVRDSQPRQFVGKVVELGGTPVGRGEVEGAVVLLLQVDGELLKARVVLEPTDYRVAGRAHLEQRDVTVKGVLVHGIRAHSLEGASSFELMGNVPSLI
jgi:hypothetical protein